MGDTCSKQRKAIIKIVHNTFDVSQLSSGILLNFNKKALNQQEINDAILSYESRLTKDSEDPLANLNMGICLYVQGFLEAAENHILKSMKNSAEYRGCFVLGLIAQQKSNYEESINFFERAISLHTLFVPALWKIAEVHLKINKIKPAKKYVKRAIDQEPENPDALNILGLAYLQSAKLSKALQILNKAYEILPDSSKINTNLGHTYKAQENLKNAIKHYELSANNSKGVQQGIAYIDLASAYFEYGDIGQSLNYFKEAVEFGPQVLYIIKNKGFDLMLSKVDILRGVQEILNRDYDDAIKRLKYIYAKNKSNLISAYLMGLAYANLGNAEKAQKYYKEVLKYGNTGINSKKQFAKTLVSKANKALMKIKELKSEENSFEDLEFEGATDFPEGSPNQIPYALDISKSGAISRNNSNPQTPKRSNTPIKEFNENPGEQAASVDISELIKQSPRYPLFTSAVKPSLKQFAASADPKPENCDIF
ncbi:unnamed protein product [Blepharisma stoltei]|uniref:Uncharacterized protein n=1 Tax=Blepharisma stoltei TaxID=1481888 RepID=A0AAU9JCC3_9CILI|nr:unnamed protein product [Blepharisma stoltei]